MPASRNTQARRWLSTNELLEAQGISRSFLSQLKRDGALKQGVHYRRLGVSHKSPMQWLESEVEATLMTLCAQPEALEVIK
jgi:hypothetical protein